MVQKMHRQGISLLLALVMLLSLAVSPAFAVQSVISIKDTEITTQSNTLTVNLTQIPTAGILRVFQLNSDAEYNSELFFNDAYQLAQGLIANLKVGDNVLTLSKPLIAGSKIVAVLRDGSGALLQGVLLSRIPARFWQIAGSACKRTGRSGRSPSGKMRLL